MTNYAENKIADFWRGQGLVLPANWYLGLASAAGEAATTELAGAGYARVSVARSLANFAGTLAVGSTAASTGTTHTTSNNGNVSWGNPGANWGTANYVVFYDASSGGNAWFYVPIPAIVITTGSPNPVQVLASALSFSLGLTGGITDYLANKMIDLIWRAQAFAWPGTLYLGLFTSAPTNAGGGTEVVSLGGYARPSLVPSLANICGTHSAGSTDASSGTGGRISNNVAVTYPSPVGADWGTALAEGIFDTIAGGNLLFWRTLAASRTINDGGSAPTHAVNTIGLTLD